MDQRKGKRIATNAKRAVKAQTPEYDLGSALKLFYNVRRTEGARPRTLKDYEVHWRYFTDWLAEKFGEASAEMKISDITQAIVRDYIYYMTAERTKYGNVDNRRVEGAGLSPTTVSIRLRTLRTMFRFWAQEGVIETNPAANVKPPKQDQEDIDTFTDEQMRLLLAAPDVTTFVGLRDKTLFMALADGGFRINEAMGLTEEMFDFKLRCVHLLASMNKNRKPRMVPLSADVLRLIMELIAENRAFFGGEDTHIFLNNYGTPLKADHVRHRLRYYAKKAGITGVKVAPHNLRHYFCKNYLLNGGDIFTLQRIVAHSNIETTRKYVKMDDNNVRNQHEKASPLTNLGIARAGRRTRQ